MSRVKRPVKKNCELRISEIREPVLRETGLYPDGEE
jgi:hypothetical protein